MCMWFWVYRHFIFYQYFLLFRLSFFFPGKYSYLFCIVWKCACGFGIILVLFFINFFHFFDLVFFFSGPISIRIDLLWAQLLLDFSTDRLETMHTCSDEDEHVVLGLSCHYFCFNCLLLFHLDIFYLWHDDVGSLWAQLLLQFHTKLFETVQVFFVMVWRCAFAFRVIFPSFVINFFFFHFFDIFQVWLVSEWIPFGCNSFYSFPSIIFKQCLLVLHGLKMIICMTC